MLAGAPFPDYLYTCGNNHDDGEFAHWSVFQGHASDYLRARGGAFANASTVTLTAFMHGVVSHYISDLQWHGMAHNLGGFGFIQTVGARLFLFLARYAPRAARRFAHVRPHVIPSRRRRCAGGNA